MKGRKVLIPLLLSAFLFSCAPKKNMTTVSYEEFHNSAVEAEKKNPTYLSAKLDVAGININSSQNIYERQTYSFEYRYEEGSWNPVAQEGASYAYILANKASDLTDISESHNAMLEIISSQYEGSNNVEAYGYQIGDGFKLFEKIRSIGGQRTEIEYDENNEPVEVVVHQIQTEYTAINEYDSFGYLTYSCLSTSIKKSSKGTGTTIINKIEYRISYSTEISENQNQ